MKTQPGRRRRGRGGHRRSGGAGRALRAVAGRAVVARAATSRRASPGSGVPGHVALTFDDGPDPASTPKFLEALDDLGWHATFFMLGDMARRSPGLAAEVAAAGHEVAVHGDRHRSQLRLTPRRGRRRHRPRARRGGRRHRRRSRSGSGRPTARCRSAGCAARGAPGCARCSGPRGVATGAPTRRRSRWWTTCSTATSTAARCCCTTRTARRRPSAGTRRSARCPRSRPSSTHARCGSVRWESTASPVPTRAAA